MPNGIGTVRPLPTPVIATAVQPQPVITMVDNDKEELDRQMNKLRARLPNRLARFVGWLQQPASRWVRIPLAATLIIGGIFSFLPILGLWMLPLGLIVLAQDVPFLRGPISRGLKWLERRWSRYSTSRHRDDDK